MVITSEHMKKQIQDTITKISVWPYVHKIKAEHCALTKVDTCHNTHNQHLDSNSTRAWKSKLEK